nr:hypothetical protein [Legionella jordanis]
MSILSRLIGRINSYSLVILSLFIIFLLNVQPIKQVLQNNYFIYEQDAYMHLEIASNLLENPTWFNHYNPRLNAPWGTTSHAWTMPITALLVSGAWLFSSFLPSASALYLWAFFLPVLFYALAAWAMLWSIEELQPSLRQKCFVLLAFLLNPFMNSFFLALRVDYDFFLIFLSIVYWGYLLRLIRNDNNFLAVKAAVIASLAMWTSLSFSLPLFIGLAFLLWASLVQKNLNGKTVLIFLFAISLCLLIIIPLEQQPVFNITHDIVSIVHLLFFLLLTLALAAYLLFFQNKTFGLQLLFFTITICFIFATENALFPGFFLGPYNQIDGYLLQHFFPNLSEFYSPFNISPSLALSILCQFILGAGYCYYSYLNHELNRYTLFIFWSALGTILLTCYMYRWIEFAVPVNILLLSFLIKDLNNVPTLLKNTLVIFIALLPAFILAIAPNFVSVDKQICEKQFYRMLQQGFLNQAQFNQNKILFAHSNFGPLLLYYTKYSIVGTNDHQNPQGLKDSIRFYHSDADTARDILLKRNVDMVLLCPSGYPTHFNPDQTTWLKSMALPHEYSAWRLYELKTTPHFSASP